MVDKCRDKEAIRSGATAAVEDGVDEARVRNRKDCMEETGEKARENKKGIVEKVGEG